MGAKIRERNRNGDPVVRNWARPSSRSAPAHVVADLEREVARLRGLLIERDAEVHRLTETVDQQRAELIAISTAEMKRRVAEQAREEGVKEPALIQDPPKRRRGRPRKTDVRVAAHS